MSNFEDGTFSGEALLLEGGAIAGVGIGIGTRAPRPRERWNAAGMLVLPTPRTSTGLSRINAPLLYDLLPSVAVDRMIIYHPGGLHVSVAHNRSHEREASLS